MKHPFWIVNSCLLLLLLLVASIMYFMRTPIMQRTDIHATAPTAGKQSAQEFTINISKIYEHDLFDTYQVEEPVSAIATIPPIPTPPEPEVASVPKIPEPQFVDPLDINLKGIVVISTQESKNRAIIQENKTGTEKTYKVGDFIHDAQLIRIFSNKVILLRSNGQQEVIYLREQDAKLDPVYSAIGGWEHVAQESEGDQYTVIRQEFVTRVKNLAHFIDLLDVTTAYKDGLSIGCRIGKIDAQSLAYYLGLKSSDIIVAINGIPTANTADRVKIYKTIMGLPDESSITVSLIRNGKEFTLSYTIESKKNEKKEPFMSQKSAEEQEKKDQEILAQKQAFAPTMDEIRKKEKALMLQKGRTPPAAMPEQSSHNHKIE
jgi:type II secretion system protein C